MKVVAVALSILAAAPAAGAELPVQLADGASWTQTTVKTRTDERQGVTSSTRVTTIIRVTYRDGGDGPATLTQELVSVETPPATSAQADFAEGLARLIFPVTVEVDESLRPTRVRDWAKMQASMRKVLDETVPDAKAREFTASFMARFDETSAAGFFKELGLVSLGQGTALSLREPAPYEDSVPNILGGPPIGTKGTFELVEHSPDNGRAVVVWKQALDPVSLAESLKLTTARLARDLPSDKLAEFNSQMASLSMARSDTCRYDIDLLTGLAMHTECTVALEGGAASERVKRTDHWIIEQSRPEIR